MREILFRGKDTVTDEWISGFLVDAKHVGDWIEAIPVHPETVGQFTGLTDCRKKKLFEHDVVTAKFKSNGARYNFKITFKDGTFLFDNGHVAVRFDQIRSAVKIGNIHDNPEL